MSNGLAKQAGHRYRHYQTLLGKQVIASGLKLKNLVLISQLALAPGALIQILLPNLVRIRIHRY